MIRLPFLEGRLEEAKNRLRKGVYASAIPITPHGFKSCGFDPCFSSILSFTFGPVLSIYILVEHLDLQFWLKISSDVLLSPIKHYVQRGFWKDLFYTKSVQRSGPFILFYTKNLGVKSIEVFAGICANTWGVGLIGKPILKKHVV